jgi:hypothetical protein
VPGAHARRLRVQARDDVLRPGTIAGEAPNAADLQIFASIRLLMAHEDLRPPIARRPCGRAALDLIPDFSRSGPDALPPVPAALPAAWLPTPPADRRPGV